MADGGVAIRIQRLSKAFRMDGDSLAAVDGVQLEIPAGSVTAVTGPSGSGKSTLLHLIGGIEAADDGAILVGDRDVAKLEGTALADYRRGIGLVFQRFNLLPALTALDNVLVPLIPGGVSADDEQRARDLLAAVGIPEKERAIPSRLSGGQQQRVAIARALIGRPRLLLADEPTGNLDTQTGRDIIELLLGLRERYGMTIVLATHDPQIAARCDRHVQLRDGRVVADDQG